MNPSTGPLDIVFGEDGYRVNEIVAEIVASHDSPLGDVNRTTFDASKLTAAELRAAITTVPFLADRRLVIVRGLLTRFAADSLTKAKLAEVAEFAETLRDRPAHTHVVLVDGPVASTKNAMLEAVQGSGARVRNVGLLAPTELRRWIEARARSRGLRLTDGAVRALEALIGPNLWVMASEIDKLALFAGDRRATEEDVHALVASAREENVFALVDNVLAGRGGAELSRLVELLAQGESPFMVMATLQNRLRQLWLLRERLDMGDPPALAKIRSGCGRLSDSAFQRAMADARRWERARFAATHQRLLTMDQAIKTGRIEPQLALELFMWDLANQPSEGAR
ncbi:MAG: DNA polymerase III subunit delta [Dehalococcoidia bacterium]|nr:DNA polymerase III subunit delta [Dehalococcoidia bacterium]